MNTKNMGKKVLKVVTKQKAVVAILFMLVAMLFFDTNFYTAYNLLDLLKSASVMEVLAFGVTLTIICGGCDLSVGGTLCLSGILTIMWMNYMPVWAAILLSVLVGALIGFVNGFFVVVLKKEPFIITLGTGMVMKGICQELTDAHPLPCTNLNFMKIANGKILGFIPNLVVIMLVIMVILYWLLRHTAYGRNCYAVGGNYNVAVYSGINALRVKWISYVICGAAAALGGILLSSKLNSGSSIYGDNTALLVNCAAVVGGTSFAGGIGGIPQTAVGILVINMLENCMNMLGIGAYMQQILEGIVIVGIIWMDCRAAKKKREDV